MQLDIKNLSKTCLNGWSANAIKALQDVSLIGNPHLIIVDKPTAGLDPMEQNCFYNLLSELGEGCRSNPFYPYLEGYKYTLY